MNRGVLGVKPLGEGVAENRGLERGAGAPFGKENT